MKLKALSLSAALLLLVPAVASAHRPATRVEKAAMMYHAGSHYAGLSAKQVDAPKAYPLKCAEADIATVVPGSRWGAWAYNGRRYKDRKCRHWASNGWVIEHKIGSRWFVLAEGDELPRHVPGVPHRIAVDVIRGLP